ncbi:phosphoesterase [Allostella sp. ATCC 35155]|nr:phosphoesterase [Stella sp. ATCC 35155]
MAILSFATALLATSAIFWTFPAIDLTVSGWFYSPGDGFTLSSDPALRLLRASSPWVTIGGVLIALFCIVREAVTVPLAWSRIRTPIWLLAGLALGPGLVVNGLLKTLWGRPRPIQIDVFGGDATYQKAWVVSDWCDRNCSFVSGEASSAAWLVAAALMTPRRIRPAATLIALVYAGAISLNRIAFGGHFLSDVVLAWLICGLTFGILHWLVIGKGGFVRSPRRRIRAPSAP